MGRRPGKCEGDTRQAGAAADVDQPGVFRDQFSHRGTVEQVTVPDAICFARTQQAANDPSIREQLAIPNSRAQLVAE
jgi:hypothetical protein